MLSGLIREGYCGTISLSILRVSSVPWCSATGTRRDVKSDMLTEVSGKRGVGPADETWGVYCVGVLELSASTLSSMLIVSKDVLKAEMFLWRTSSSSGITRYCCWFWALVTNHKKG